MSQSRILAESIRPFILPDTSRQRTRSIAFPSAAATARSGAAGGLFWPQTGTTTTVASKTAATQADLWNARDIACSSGDLSERRTARTHSFRRDCNSDGLGML